ncbi:SPB3 protein, partial [Acromyrmex heyeri]
MLTDARFKFALECLKKCIMMKPKNNIFFSPHLLYHKLLLVYFGALYDLECTLKEILYIPDTSKRIIEEYYANEGGNHFCYENGSNNSYTCRIYYKIMIDSSKELFIDTLTLHSATNSVKEYTFNIYADLVRNFVNNIVTCTTQRCIENLLPPNSIDKNTEIIMLNTIYLKGQNHKESYDDLDELHEDTLLAKHIKCKNKNFNNDKSEHLDAFITEVPCKEKKITTFYLYPANQSELEEDILREIQKLIELIEQLTTEEGSQELRNLLDNGVKGVPFPIVINDTVIEHDLPIYELFDKLGIPEFTPDLCTAQIEDYSFNSVKLGDIIHRVSINMTSKDIVATASNVLFTYNGYKHTQKIPEDANVVFPCICLIYDRLHRNMLFCGVLWERY